MCHSAPAHLSAWWWNRLPSGAYTGFGPVASPTTMALGAHDARWGPEPRRRLLHLQPLGGSAASVRGGWPARNTLDSERAGE
jgi:hypothetical protein